MGTHSTFEFTIGSLEFSVGFDSSYGVYREYMDIPAVWKGNTEQGESLVIYDVDVLVDYWDKNPPNYEALQELHILLKNTPIEKIVCWPYTWDGFPKEYQFQGERRITLSYGL